MAELHSVPALPSPPTGADPPPLTDPRWAEALRQVVDQPDLLSLHAQPIVELTSGTIAGYELL